MKKLYNSFDGNDQSNVKMYKGYRLKSSLKDIFASKTELNKLRTDVYKKQSNLLRQRENNMKKAREAGLHESLIEEMFPKTTFYDIKTMSNKNQMKKALKEIEKEKNEIQVSWRKIKYDIKAVEKFTSKTDAKIAKRNTIIKSVLDDMSESERFSSNPNAMQYTKKEELAGLTGNPRRYLKKEYYLQERRKLRKIEYNPYYKTQIYRENALSNLNYAIENAKKDGLSQDDISKITEIKTKFSLLTDEEIDAFSRLNTYQLAELIMSSSPVVIRSNYKLFVNIFNRIEKASGK